MNSIRTYCSIKNVLMIGVLISALAAIQRDIYAVDYEFSETVNSSWTEPLNWSPTGATPADIASGDTYRITWGSTAVLVTETVVNHGYISVGGNFENYATIENYGYTVVFATLNNYHDFINYSGAQLGCLMGGGTIHNSGSGSSLENYGTFFMEDSGVFINDGDFTGSNFSNGGEFINNGNFIHNNGTFYVTDPSSNGAIVRLNVPSIFNNVYVGSGKIFWEQDTGSTSNASLEGTLTNLGTVRKEITIDGPGDYIFGLTGAKLHVTEPGSSLLFTIDRIDSDHPQAWEPLLTGIYWHISPDGSDYLIDLTLPHDITPDTNAYLARHESGETWSINRSASTVDTVTLNDISELAGDWTVSDGDPCFHHGDVDFSGSITAGDAQLAFNIAVGLIMPTYDEQCAADCNGDDSVTAGDAQQIFNAVFGLESCVDSLPG